MAAALRAVHRLHGFRRRIRIFRDRTQPLDLYDDDELFRRFRFPRMELLAVIDRYSNDLQPFATRKGSLPPSLQIMIALRFYATGSFQEVVGDIFGVSKATVCMCIRRVSQVLSNSLNGVVSFEDQRGADATKRQFFDRFGMPGVIGCVDGTHVRIVCPSQYEGVYVCRKGYHSINIQLICDYNLKILNTVIKHPGSAHDARILRESMVFHAFEQDPPPLTGHLLGDSAYMLRYD